MKILITCYWVIEMFEVKNTLTTEIVKDIFMESNENHYYLRNQNDFRQPLKTIYRDSENISCIGPKIWDNIPKKSKESISTDNFKSQSESGYQKTTPGDHT